MYLSDLQLAKTSTPTTIIPEIPNDVSASILSVEQAIQQLANQYATQRANNERTREIEQLIVEINRRVSTADQFAVRVNNANTALQPLLKASIPDIARQAEDLSRALTQASAQLLTIRTQLIALRNQLTTELSNLERSIRQ